MLVNKGSIFRFADVEVRERELSVTRIGCVLCLLLCSVIVFSAVGESVDVALQRKTSSMRLGFDGHKPGLSSLSIDALKRDTFRASPMVDAGDQPSEYVVSGRGDWVTYALKTDPAHPVWEMRCNGDTLQMRSLFRPNGA